MNWFRAGLLEREGGRALLFRHPLLQEATYQAGRPRCQRAAWCAGRSAHPRPRSARGLRIGSSVGSDAWPLVGDDVERGEPGEGGQDPGRDGGEAEWSGQRAVGQGDLVMAAMAMDDSSRVGVALAEGLAGAQDEHDGEFGDGRFGEPAAVGQVALAWNPGRRVRKVRMPDTELSRPKTIMKVRMDRDFQVRARPGCLGSMLPGQHPGSAGAGDRRLAGRLLRQEGRHPWRTP